MNSFSGHISFIQSYEQMSMVEVQVSSEKLYALVIDTQTSDPQLIIDQPAKILFKETEVILSHPDWNSSLPNKLEVHILKIKKGDLLHELTLSSSIGEIKCILDEKEFHALQPSEGQTCQAHVKSNEIMLSI